MSHHSIDSRRVGRIHGRRMKYGGSEVVYHAIPVFHQIPEIDQTKGVPVRLSTDYLSGVHKQNLKVSIRKGSYVLIVTGEGRCQPRYPIFFVIFLLPVCVHFLPISIKG